MSLEESPLFEVVFFQDGKLKNLIVLSSSRGVVFNGYCMAIQMSATIGGRVTQMQGGEDGKNSQQVAANAKKKFK